MRHSLASRAALALLAGVAAGLVLLLWMLGSRTAREIVPGAAIASRAEPAQVPATAERLARDLDPAEGVRVSARGLRASRGQGAPERGTEQQAAPVPTETACVRVLVRAREDGQPVAGVRVSAVADSGSDSALTRCILRTGTPPVTGADGLSELELAAGQPAIVEVSDAWLQEGRRELAALSPGEMVRIEIELATRADAELHGVLVAEESELPLRGTLHVLDRRASEATSATGSDGRFALPAFSWKKLSVRAEAPGRGAVVFPLYSEQGSAAQPLRVRLPASAALEVCVRDSSGDAIEGAEVEIRGQWPVAGIPEAVWFYSSPTQAREWSARTDAQGRAVVGALPPGQRLALCVDRSGFARNESEEAVCLRAGERRQVDLVLSRGTTLVGRLENARGRALHGRLIWLMPAATHSGELFRSHEDPPRVAKTDAEGGFEIRRVAPGSWCIGLAPSEGQDEPPVAELVEIRDVPEQDVLLHARPGLRIRGRVLDTAGAPAAGVEVEARAEQRGIGALARTDATGDFCVGPLPPGSYDLRATGRGTCEAPSPPLEVEAGTEGLWLALQAGSTLSGTLVDALGRPRAGDVTCGRRGAESDPGSWRMTLAREDGGFRFEGLLPGSYVLMGRALDDSAALLDDLVLAPGAPLDVGALRLAPAARLRLVQGENEERVAYRISTRGAPIDAGVLERGAVLERSVPSGELLVQAANPGAPWGGGTTLRLQAGDQRTIVLPQDE